MPIGTKRAILNTPQKTVPLTFARAGVAYDPYGNTVIANQPRFNKMAGKSGILIEESTTNLFTSVISQNLTTSYTTGTLNGTYTFSCGTGSYILSGGATGTVTPSTPQTKTISNATVTITGTSTLNQLELKAYSTSWVIGGTTRNAETLTIPSSVLNIDTNGTGINGSGTIECEAYIPNPSTAWDYGNALMIHTSDPTLYSDRIYLCIRALGLPSGRIYPHDATTQSVNGVLTTGWHKYGLTWDKNSFTFYIDGVPIGTFANPRLPTVFGQLHIGTEMGNRSWFNSLIRNVCVSKIKRTNIDMQNRANQQIHPIDNQVSAFALLESDLRGVAKV
jgi:hypothetical protein